MSLLLIKDTVQQVADAITAALEIETEIVDEKLMIVGGTGRYKDKIGAYEENGDLNSQLVYAVCINTGQEHINFNPINAPFYDAKEGKVAPKLDVNDVASWVALRIIHETLCRFSAHIG